MNSLENAWIGGLVLLALGSVACPERSHAVLTSDLAFVTGYQVPGGDLGAFTAMSALVVSPDGAHVYTASMAHHPGKEVPVWTAMARDAATGQLTLAQLIEGGRAAAPELQAVDPPKLAISPDGKHVYSVSVAPDFVTGFISVLLRDPATGVLVPGGRWDDGTSGIVGLSLPGAIAVSPGGEHVYVAGAEVVVFDRDPVSGGLTFVEAEAGAVPNGTGIALSPDGASLYVTHRASSTMTVFDRDPGTGALTLRESHTDGMGGVSGMDRALGVAVSPDGANVYVGSSVSDSLAVFDREAGTGSLTFAAAVPQRGSELAVSPDGSRVYGGALQAGVRVFARDLGTGALTVIGVSGTAPDRFEWLVGPLAVSPDGRHVYAGDPGSGRQSGRLGLLQRVAVSCGATPEPGCRSSTTPGVSLLQVKEAGIHPFNPKPDTVKFKLGRGEATDAGALGDPTTSTDYAVCLYDQTMFPQQPLLEVNVESGNVCPQKPCWKRSSNGGVSFRDTRRRRSGLKQLKLKPGEDGKASVSLGMAGFRTIQEARTPLSPPVLVQVLNSLGECWEQSFSAPILNDNAQFKAKQ